MAIDNTRGRLVGKSTPLAIRHREIRDQLKIERLR
jgi:hypothetical protein